MHVCEESIRGWGKNHPTGLEETVPDTHTRLKKCQFLPTKWGNIVPYGASDSIFRKSSNIPKTNEGTFVRKRNDIPRFHSSSQKSACFH